LEYIGAWTSLVCVCEERSSGGALGGKRRVEQAFEQSVCEEELLCGRDGFWWEKALFVVVVVRAWFGRVEPRSSSSLRSWFVVVSEPGSFVRRRQSAGVGAGAFGCKLRELLGLPRRHVPTDGRRASGQKGSVHFLSSLGFFWGVCVCVRPRPLV